MWLFLYGGGNSLKKIEMIKSHREFTEIIQKEKYIKNHDFSIYIRKGKYSYPHFGIAVSKKLGNAVTRNKLKRRMRMILDEWKKDLKYNEDYIIIMKESVRDLSFKEMQDSFLNLMKQRSKHEKTK